MRDLTIDDLRAAGIPVERETWATASGDRFPSYWIARGKHTARDRSWLRRAGFTYRPDLRVWCRL